jgi:hypothetical protein
MPETPPPNLRPELREDYFRKFEPAIKLAVLSYPQPITVDWTKTGFRFSTILSRLRDALVSFRRFHWQTDWFNPAEHGAILGKIKCSAHESQENLIVIGAPPSTAVTFEQVPFASSVPSDKEPLELMLAQLLTCYCVLASARVPNLPRFRILSREDEPQNQEMTTLLQALAQQYDVAFLQDLKGWILY